MNAPYDARFKTLAEEFPELLLRMLGIVGPGTKTNTIHLIREVHLDPLQVDHVYKIDDDRGPRVAHFEAITSWRTKRVPRLALYHLLLEFEHKLPVSSYVILMAEKYCHESAPPKVVYQRDDGLRIEAPYQIIRLWEIDASVAFEPGCEALLPWVPLLKGGDAEFERASGTLEWFADHPEEAPYPVDVMVSNIAALATLRYDKEAIKHFLGRLQRKIMLTMEVFEDSWLYQDGVAAGKAEGEAKGKAEGEFVGALNAKRGSVRLALKKRFPAMEMPTEIDRIDRLEALDELLLAIMDAQGPEDVRAAVQAAIRVN